MASRQAWISNKNVCVLYRVTAAAGLLREPQPSRLPWNTHSHTCTLIQTHMHTELAGLRDLFLLRSHGSIRSSSAVGLSSESGWNTAWAEDRCPFACVSLKKYPRPSDTCFDVSYSETDETRKSFIQWPKLCFSRAAFKKEDLR